MTDLAKVKESMSWLSVSILVLVDHLIVKPEYK